MQKKSLNYIRKTKAYRLSEILRLLYGGKNISTQGMCNHFFGKDVRDADIRSMQRDFEFLVEETNIPIESYYEKGQDVSLTHYMIYHDNIKTGQKKVGEMEIFASLIQDKYTRIFKNTGFQEVLDNTYSIIQDFYSSDLDDKFQLQDELLDFYHNIETGLFDYSIWTEDIGLIITAILKQEFIQYKYRSAKATEYKNHKVFPVKMIYNSGTLYLYVYNLDEEKDRDYFMITLHRIKPGTVEVHKIFEIEEYLKTKIKRYHEEKLVFKQSIPDKDLEKRKKNIDVKNKKFLEQKELEKNFMMSTERFITEVICDVNIEKKRAFSFGLVWNQKNIQNVVLEFDKYLVNQIENRDWHFNPILEYLGNGNLLMKMKIDVNRELVNWIIVRLHQIKIHEPQELIDMIQERLKVFQAEHNLKNNKKKYK